MRGEIWKHYNQREFSFPYLAQIYYERNLMKIKKEFLFISTFLFMFFTVFFAHASRVGCYTEWK